MLLLCSQLRQRPQQGVLPDVLGDAAHGTFGSNVRGIFVTHVLPHLGHYLIETHDIIPQVLLAQVAEVAHALGLEVLPCLLLTPPLLKGAAFHSILEILHLGVVEPVHVWLELLPGHVGVDAVQELGQRVAVLEIRMWQIRLPSLDAVSYCRSCEGRCGDEHAVTEDQILPPEADELAIADQHVLYRCLGLRQNRMHHRYAIELGIVMRINVEVLASPHS